MAPAILVRDPLRRSAGTNDGDSHGAQGAATRLAVGRVFAGDLEVVLTAAERVDGLHGSRGLAGAGLFVTGHGDSGEEGQHGQESGEDLVDGLHFRF